MIENLKPMIGRFLDVVRPFLEPYRSDPYMMLLLVAAGGLGVVGLLFLLFRRRSEPDFPYAADDSVSAMNRVLKTEQAMHDIQKKINVLSDVHREKIDELKDCVNGLREAFKSFDRSQREKLKATSEQLQQVTQDVSEMKAALQIATSAPLESGSARAAGGTEASLVRPEPEPISQPEAPRPAVKAVPYAADLTATRRSSGATPMKEARLRYARSPNEVFFKSR
jgi:hypothetical protein